MHFRGSCDKFKIKFYANRTRTKVNFELSIEISKDMSVFSRAWEKDEILSPSRGIETETFGFRSIMLYH